MSFVTTVPELVTTAADNLAGIGATLEQTAAAAAGSTTGVAAAAADEVSAAISQLFGTFGREFQAVNSKAAAFHADFVRLLSRGAAAYVTAEIANAGTTLVGAINAPVQSLLNAGVGGAGVAAPAVPGGAYGQLFVNTATNLQALGSAWGAHPFPLLNQVIANQLRYFQQIPNVIQNLPAILAGLPTNIQAFLTYNWAQQIQQFVTAQIGYTQAFVVSMNKALGGLVAGLPAFGSQLQIAFQTALTGDFYGAVQEVGTGLARLAITGFDTSNYTVNVNVGGTLLDPVIDITANTFPVPLGPLPDFFTAISVIGQDAQYLTNLIPPGTVPRQISQNFTNLINTVSDPSIEAIATLQILGHVTATPPFLTATATGSLSAFFGLPIALSYASVGGPINLLYGMATSATSIQQALATGNYLGALGAVVDSPAVVLNSFLNGQVIEDIPIAVPTQIPPAFAPPLPSELLITLHLPFNGILVPPHTVTATVSTNSQIPIPGLPFEATIFGTPFMGMAPLLLNYLPQQLAAAIKPA